MATSPFARDAPSPGDVTKAEGLQEQREKALEYTQKWRVTVNLKKCAVVVGDEDKVNR